MQTVSLKSHGLILWARTDTSETENTYRGEGAQNRLGKVMPPLYMSTQLSYLKLHTFMSSEKVHFSGREICLLAFFAFFKQKVLKTSRRNSPIWKKQCHIWTPHSQIPVYYNYMYAHQSFFITWEQDIWHQRNIALTKFQSCDLKIFSWPGLPGEFSSLLSSSPLNWFPLVILGISSWPLNFIGRITLLFWLQFL